MQTLALQATLSAELGQAVVLTGTAAGGCVSASFTAQAGSTPIFVKTGSAEQLPMFQAEADGLAALSKVGSHRLPAVLALRATEDTAFLVLEQLDLTPIATPEQAARCGEALAALHHHQGETYGWHQDNFIGASPQANDPSDSWALFFARRRLAPQFARARHNGAPAAFIADGEKLISLVPAFFLDFRPAPSLLHGDLWHGNAAMVGDQPALFDPSVHYGDREADLAMTELFGGFPHRFYAAYRAAWPLSPDYERRKTLYNLYHVLNHFNLFGSGYLNQAKRMVARLLSEVRS